MDLLILGIEKTGTFVNHFDAIDQTDQPGVPRFGPRTYLLLTDKYIKARISLSDSQKRCGVDTSAFGASLFLQEQHRRSDRSQHSIPDGSRGHIGYRRRVLVSPIRHGLPPLLDKLASNRYPNAVTPLVSAHAEAAIPLELGHKVLQQLAKALMRRD